MNATSKFWPLDYDQEVEIYENLSWDLPGWKRFGRRSRKPRGPLPRGRRSATNSEPRP